MIDQQKIDLATDAAGETPVQFAALCLRQKGKRKQVMMVTSRDTGRWVLPKGWMMADKSGPEVAEIEAWEEAGVVGRVNGQAVGSYIAIKDKVAGETLTCRVEVYPVQVDRIKSKFPESEQRTREWMNLDKAAAAVLEEGLSEIFKSLI